MAIKKKDEADNTTISKTETAVMATETTEKIETVTEEKTVIYAGASLPGARCSTVFKGELPEILHREYISELCIPVEEFSEFLKKKNVTSSREALCYRKSVQLAAELARQEGK
ncbi:MAG: hypothetical protein Q4G33_06030 [bacterium]|nr:hypothetical protein [bacterium]